MRPLRALVIYIVVVFIGGALLAPWLYWLAQAFAHSFPKIAAEPFHRFVDRSLLILALAGLWPLLRSLGVTSWREAGVVPPHGQWKKLFGGLLLGFVSLAIVAAMAFAGGAGVFTQTATAHQVVGTHFQRHRHGRRGGASWRRFCFAAACSADCGNSFTGRWRSSSAA